VSDKERLWDNGEKRDGGGGSQKGGGGGGDEGSVLTVEEVGSIQDSKYMVGRETVPAELEESYRLGPFEMFPLYLGKVRT